MAIRDLLVLLDDSKFCKQRVMATLSFAADHGAHVVGVALAIRSTISDYIGVKLPAGFGESQREAVEKAAAKGIKRFEKMATEAGVSFETHIISKSAAKAPSTLAFYARHIDLTVLGQSDPDHGNASFNTALMEGVLFESGRPVYLVPYVGNKVAHAHVAVVAWDGGHKSARAVNDAIPLLKSRDETIILVINPDERAGAHGNIPGADITAHLARHGVKARIERTTNRDIGPDKVILNFLAETSADLLVMGAYGHSRLREMALGGVTQTVLREMTASVFMSH